MDWSTRKKKGNPNKRWIDNIVETGEKKLDGGFYPKGIQPAAT
jgi:hypothetical protein